MTVSSLCTLMLQLFVMPWQSKRKGSSPQIWIVLGALATVIHALAIASAAATSTVFAVCWLPALSAAADPVLTAVISKTRGSAAAGDVAEDQGLILGAFTGLKTLFGCLGPVLMALMLQAGQPHRSFVMLAMLMVPATVMAFQMYCDDVRSKQGKDAEWTQGYAGARSTGA
mmetsp:Transcript_45927/g.100312  ORF Transcript_45927/g.100312 Transcript_45927/m.100312 type:complete len:171 (+) Transcript_45927:475-987(+)